MSPQVETLLLPRSQYRVQWRDDGYWRALPLDQWEQVEWIDRQDPLSWAAWTGAEWQGGLIVNNDRAVFGAYGTMPDDGSDVTVRWADGTPVPVLHVGKMWACEWPEPQQQRFDVTFKGEVLPVERRPRPPEDV
ncbi:MAG TPA: hypothetical protein VGJ59_18230 [Jatrophihabitantaceae bacterium]|jgi:hypothetical protein